MNKKIEAILILIRPYAWTNTALPMLLANYIATGSFDILALLPYFLIVGPIFWGGGYTLNDVIDYKTDSYHELKKQRPIPLRWISRAEALVFACFMMGAGLTLMYLLDGKAFLVLLLMFLGHVIYTVPPLRAKTRKYLDLPFSGPLNSVCRLSIGWMAVSDVSTLPPELLFMLFFLTCFIYLLYRSPDVQAFIKDGIMNSYSTLGVKRTIGISFIFLLLFYGTWGYACLWGFLTPSALIFIPFSASIIPAARFVFETLSKLPPQYFRQMYPATYTAYLIASWNFIVMVLAIRLFTK